MIAADEALARLLEGNRRFVAGSGMVDAGFEPFDPAEAQRPVAAVLGCADSRVPPELIFGQGPGQLFVSRVAGAVATRAQIETLEFAVGAVGVRLIVVLGHEGCIAVSTALDPAVAGGRYLHSVTEALRAALGSPAPVDLDSAVLAATRATCETLRRESGLIREQLDKGGLKIVGARYSLHTGAVEFLDGVESETAT